MFINNTNQVDHHIQSHHDQNHSHQNHHHWNHHEHVHGGQRLQMGRAAESDESETKAVSELSERIAIEETSSSLSSLSLSFACFWTIRKNC